MSPAPTPEEVRAFVVRTLDAPLRQGGLDPAALDDDLDLVQRGVIDSFGVIELIGEVNAHFDVEIDFEELDPEGLTVLGSFSRYVAGAAAAA